jgi:hypothetical protein
LTVHLDCSKIGNLFCRLKENLPARSHTFQHSIVNGEKPGLEAQIDILLPPSGLFMTAKNPVTLFVVVILISCWKFLEHI